MKLYSHKTTYFYQMKLFSKVTNTHLYINQKKLNKKFFKVYTYMIFHGSPMAFHMHNNVPKIFHINYHMKVNAH